ncbi:MAG: GTP cyclohydrolase FolE2 [Desulfopila sp.]|jgi:GTP cyclohydrolase I|nr:GTP cyclohydrolase FolE2 [Desulfopila sp.]
MTAQIQVVGIKDIQLPIKVREKDGGLQNTVATITLRVNMPGRHRESCLSVFTSILNKYLEDITYTNFSKILEKVKQALDAKSAELEMNFPYFIEKRAPVTGTKGLMEYSCTFTGTSAARNDFIVSVNVPVTTLCPCSKEISEAGAHNQRAEVCLNVKFSKFIWVEDLIEIIEKSASCELYSLLKRPDEKFVTEQAFKNPMFVEDVVRKVAQVAYEHPSITWFSAGVESFESIHKHSAYAYVDSSEMR